MSAHQLLAQCLNQLRIHSSHLLHRGLAAELPIHCLEAEAVENGLGVSYDLKVKREDKLHNNNDLKLTLQRVQFVHPCGIARLGAGCERVPSVASDKAPQLSHTPTKTIKPKSAVTR